MSVTWIEASAGTGKTYTLVQTVVHLVKDRGLGVDQILMVTFTEKATAELKTRVRQGLRDAWKETRDPRLSQALEDLPAMMVTTLHGFCRALLAQFPLESGVSFTPELVDQDRQWRRLLRDEVRPRLADLDAELLAWAGLEDEEALLGLAARALNQGVFSLPLAHPTDAERAQFQAWRRDLTEGTGPLAEARTLGDGLARPLPADLADSLDPSLYFKSNWYKSPYAAVRSVLEARTTAELLGCLKPKTLESLGKWDEDSTIWKKGAPDLPPRLQTLKDVALAFCQGAEAWLSALEPGTDLAFFFEGCARHQVLADLCGPVLQRRSPTELTYHDLIDRVRRLVTSQDSALAQAASARWSTVLIDEFQDTDPEQWDIFSALFLNPQHDLILVGDPKQSIYRFRGADLNLYRAVRNQVKAQGAQTLVLDQNFRSTAAMVEALNQAFDPGRTPWDHPDDFTPSRKGDKAIDELVRSTPTGTAPMPPLAVFQTPGTDREWHDHLVRTVLDLLAHGSLVGTDGSRPVTPGDFLVLVRRKREAWVLFRKLSALGVPATVGGSGGLLASREAQEVLLFLKALESPRSVSAARALAWTRPFRGLTDDALLAALDDAQGDRRQGAYLRAFRRVAAQVDQGEVDGGGLEHLLVQSGGARLVTNLEHVLELVQERHHLGQVPRGRAALALETWIQARLQEDEVDLRRDGEAPTLRLMTIHAAKGLEAPIVLHGFPGEPPADREPWLTARGADFLRTAESVAAEAADRNAEDLRLRYVALTRARTHQVFCDPEGVPLSTPTGPTLRWAARTKEAATTRLAPALDGLDRRHPWVESHSGLWRRATRDEAKAATVWDRPRVRDDETASAEPSAADQLPAGPAFGDLVHDILEAADYRGWAPGAPDDARNAVDQVVEDLCQGRRGLFQGRDLTRPLGDWLGRVLATPLGLGTNKVTFTGLAPEDTRRELEFHLPLAHRGSRTFVWGGKEFVVHQGYLTGRIDLLFRVGSKLYLADWKTNRLSPGQTPRDLMAEAGYDLQAQWYWEALRRLCALQGEALEPAGVLYVFLRGAGDQAQGVFLGPEDLERPTLTPFLGEVIHG